MKYFKFISITLALLIILTSSELVDNMDQKCHTVKAEFVNSKNLGKLAMIAVLFTSAYIVKRFIGRDRKAADAVRKELGKPDQFIEFQDGFDRWKIEWYGDKILAFRNGCLSKNYPESIVKNKEKYDIK